MKKSKITLLLLALVIMLTGCSSSKGEVSESSNNKNDKKDKIRIAAQATSGQVFQYMAEEKKYLEEENLDVELVYINNGSDAFSALSSGQVDIISTYGTGGPLIQIENGQDFKIIGGYMIIGATPVFAMPETKYENLEDLRGKTIAIMRGGTPDIVLKGILHRAGFDLEKDVNFIEMKKNTDVMEAVRSGQADFGSVSTGFELQIEEAGMEVVMWPDELWENHSCCRMLTNNKWFEGNQDAVKKLMRAYLRAEKDMSQNMDQVVDLVTKNLDMSKETAESFVLSEHMIYDTDPYKNSVVDMWNVMNDFGYINNKEINIEDYIDTKVYKDALDELLKEYPDEKFYQEKLETYKNNNE